MARWRNPATGIVVAVADHKDDRFGDPWVPADTTNADTEGAPAGVTSARRPTK